MGTYNANFTWFTRRLNSALAAFGNQRLIVGLETTNDDTGAPYTANELAPRFAALAAAKVTNLALWDLPVTDAWWPFLAGFPTGEAGDEAGTVLQRQQQNRRRRGWQQHNHQHPHTTVSRDAGTPVQQHSDEVWAAAGVSADLIFQQSEEYAVYASIGASLHASGRPTFAVATWLNQPLFAQVQSTSEHFTRQVVQHHIVAGVCTYVQWHLS
jgi:hypothetical protein